MDILILWLSFLITYLVFIGVFVDQQVKWRLAMVSATTIWGGSLAIMTELLSPGGWIDRKSLFLGWVIYSGVFLGISFYLLYKVKPWIGFEAFYRSIKEKEWLKQKQVIILIGFVLFTLLITGITAVMAPPNNWDSMTYHMSRVAHWVQNQDLAFYPTSILRQLYYQPFAEYVILHHYILGSGDRYVNLVQWASMVGCIVGVSLIALYLGGSGLTQTLSAFVAATVPMAILQSSSTQNDLVLSFWVVSYIVLIFQIRSNSSILWWILAGISLGLILLTKATGLIYIFPFSIWLFFDQVKKTGWVILKYVMILALISLLIITPFYYRSGLVDLLSANRQLTNPYPEVAPVFNGNFLPSTVFSNVIRNLSLHFTITSRVTRYVERSVEMIHEFINIDVDDPETTFQYVDFDLIWSGFLEDSTGNPIHLLLIVAGVMYIFLSEKLKEQKKIIFYMLLCLSTFVLFSALLRWQPWNSRLQLPFFFLCTPFIAFMLINTFSQKAIWMVIFILATYSLFPLFLNVSRPIVGSSSILFTDRTTQYFKNRPELEYSYVETVARLNRMKCSKVGVLLGVDDWEYPFWALFDKTGLNIIRIEHVAVSNSSNLFERGEFSPCSVIMTEDINVLNNEARALLNKFTLIERFPYVSIYSPSGK